MTNPTTCLCLVVWNERRGCEVDVPQMNLSLFDEVFAIDGGSTDGTAEFLESRGIEVRRQEQPSLNAAYWQAVETATSDNIVVFFPKGTLDPKILDRFVFHLAQGAQLVVASRIGKDSRNEEDSRFFKPRKWGVMTLALISASLWRREGCLIWDVLHGVKAFSRDAFLEMRPAREGITIDLEMSVRAYRLRLKRVQFPVEEMSRSYGSTRFKLVPTALSLGKFLISEVFGSK